MIHCLLWRILRTEAQLMLFQKIVNEEYEDFHYFLLKLKDSQQRSF